MKVENTITVTAKQIASIAMLTAHYGTLILSVHIADNRNPFVAAYCSALGMEWYVYWDGVTNQDDDTLTVDSEGSYLIPTPSISDLMTLANACLTTRPR